MTTAPTLPPFRPLRDPLPEAGWWDQLLGRRCPARLHPGEVVGHHGRCVLRWHSPEQLDHALAPGRDFTVRWKAKVWAS